MDPGVSLEKQFLMSKLQYCVYVLLSLKDKKLYIGSTSNLKQRLTDHFHGQSKATASRRPFKLIFCEYFLSKKDAMRREGYFKTTAGKKALKLMLRKSLTEVEKMTF
jgi:putative endonuclease